MSEDASRTRESYDELAATYTERIFTELAGKPLDRHLLNRFAEDVRDHGLVADLGCGPGHVARYLHDQGVRMLGVDLSPRMIDSARQRSPGIEFRVGDMRALDLPDGALAGIVAFYSLIHIGEPEMGATLRELRRVLAPGGLLLVAFHIGEETVHRDELWGHPVSLDFRFLMPSPMVARLIEAGFVVLERVEREPYPEVEHPSRRCYLLARSPADQ
jgi:SAM-dependent methyltransferase